MSSIEVNGPAVRALRIANRIEPQALAERIGKTRAYLVKIELGHSPRVSLETLEALERELGITDRRVLTLPPKVEGGAPFPAAS